MRPASTPGVLLALLAAPLLADTFAGKVVGVTDGDTISVMRAGRAVKVRLHGIDCPEGGQDFGRRAKQFMSGLVFVGGMDVNLFWLLGRSFFLHGAPRGIIPAEGSPAD
jgi:endonuclease YncB( thermonuclease family)